MGAGIEEGVVGEEVLVLFEGEADGAGGLRVQPAGVVFAEGFNACHTHFSIRMHYIHCGKSLHHTPHPNPVRHTPPHAHAAAVE